MLVLNNEYQNSEISFIVNTYYTLLGLLFVDTHIFTLLITFQLKRKTYLTYKNHNFFQAP